MRVFGCRKFSRLNSERSDRELTPREVAFMFRHRMACEPCSEHESQGSIALNMLRAESFEVEASPMFEERVIRKLRVHTTRESLRYWSPAVAGAFIAGLAVVAAMQIITRSSQLPHVRLPRGEARRITISAPTLDRNIDATRLR